jgi:hypothetical protein
MLFFSGATPLTGLSWARSWGAQRSMICDLSNGVALDQARTDKPALGVVDFGVGGKCGPDCDDATAGDAIGEFIAVRSEGRAWRMIRSNIRVSGPVRC